MPEFENVSCFVDFRETVLALVTEVLPIRRAIRGHNFVGVDSAVLGEFDFVVGVKLTTTVKCYYLTILLNHVVVGLTLLAVVLCRVLEAVVVGSTSNAFLVLE